MTEALPETLPEIAEEYELVKDILLSDVSHTTAAKRIREYTGFKTTEASVRRWRKRHGKARLPLYSAEKAAATISGESGGLVYVTQDNPSPSFSAPQVTPPAVLLIDIETSPVIAAVWDVWNPVIRPENVIQDKEIICFAAKWLDRKDVMYRSVYHDGKTMMLNSLWYLLDRADIVEHYNGDSFDLPIINAEFIKADMTPPSPSRSVDYFKIVKKNFKFTFKGMDEVSKLLGVSGKSHGKLGMSTWLDCLQDDNSAWERMMEYNIQDVLALEELRPKLLPWMSNPPNMGLYTGKEFVCTTCGSEDVQKRGYRYTATARYHSFKCNDCGHWSRSKKKDFSVELRG